MSCFGLAATTTAVSGLGTRGGKRPWRWWRSKCAGLAAAVGSRLRRSVRGFGGRRRSVRGGWRRRDRHRHRQSFAPVYVDELYSHHHQPAKALNLNLHAVVAQAQPSGVNKPNAPAGAAAALATRATGGAKATARVASAATTTATGVAARASGGKHQARAAAGVGAMRSVLMRSPGRGGGGVLAAVKGMGEVDLRAELFIRKFREDMRLQSQRSAEELQAMLQRGL
ncbi:hypothetical protein ACP70R_003555 [Stipagrostis hirtigluma subsp. patula]